MTQDTPEYKMQNSEQEIKITVVYTPVQYLRAGEKLMQQKKQEQDARCADRQK
jgi:hypothetical protein